MGRNPETPVAQTLAAGPEKRAGEEVLPGHRKLPRTYVSRWDEIVKAGGIVENLATSAMWADVRKRIKK